MARPLRIDVPGGWYAVCARGTERRIVFCDERHCEHFLELLEEIAERFAVGVHAYVLMGNHYHLIVRTPHANLSQAMQWLNVSYSAWFNAKQGRVGHVFQGRFGSRLIDGEGSWLLQASVYLHLNPVRVSDLGLGKSQNRAEAKGSCRPTREETAKRLRILKSHCWSSYPAYAGYSPAPAWLTTRSLLARAGGKARYREDIEAHVTRGEAPEEYSTVRDRLLIGSNAFVEAMKKKVGKVTTEQPERSILRELIPIERILETVESEKGEKWADFQDRYGDWGKGLVLYLARKRGGYTLRELGDWLEGVNYKTVSKQIQRFEQKLDDDRSLARKARRCLRQLSTVET